jgi:hypothetical protein
MNVAEGELELRSADLTNPVLIESWSSDPGTLLAAFI